MDKPRCCSRLFSGRSSRLRWQSTAGQYLEMRYWWNLWRNIWWVHKMFHTGTSHTLQRLCTFHWARMDMKGPLTYAHKRISESFLTFIPTSRVKAVQALIYPFLPRTPVSLYFWPFSSIPLLSFFNHRHIPVAIYVPERPSCSTFNDAAHRHFVSHSHTLRLACPRGETANDNNVTLKGSALRRNLTAFLGSTLSVSPLLPWLPL